MQFFEWMEEGEEIMLCDVFYQRNHKKKKGKKERGITYNYSKKYD